MLLAVRQCHGIDGRCLDSSMINGDDRRLRCCNDEAPQAEQVGSVEVVQEEQTLFEQEMGVEGFQAEAGAGRAAVVQSFGSIRAS